MGTLSSWKTASSFGYNVWITGCTWLLNLFTYSLAVIRPWRVIMHQQNTVPWYCYPNHHRTSPMFHCWNTVCIPDCRLPCVFSKCKFFLMQRTAWRTTHLNISLVHFQLSMPRFCDHDPIVCAIWVILSVNRGL
jgi:hypothetical protein